MNESSNPTETEITAPVDLCRSDGTLNPEAVGFSRFPLHTCNLSGRWGRKKRWDYWCITSDDFVLSLTYADIDYLGLAAVWFLDRRSNETFSAGMGTPLGIGFDLPDTVGGGPMRYDHLGLDIYLREEAAGTRLGAAARKRDGRVLYADVLVALPEGHETLSVVVPWDERTFQYTSKHNTRPAIGWVRTSGESYEAGSDTNSWGCLDFGRGIWPHRVAWNWGSASGRCGGRVVGLQLGGRWTDGTGSTENGIMVDGRLHKISETLEWTYDRRDWKRPWRIRTPHSESVDLTFTPEFERAEGVNLGVAGTQVHQCFGTYQGTIRCDDGSPISVEGLYGWAEEARQRW